MHEVTVERNNSLLTGRNFWKIKRGKKRAK